MSDSRFADLLQAGADALAPRSTPPGGWQPPTVEQLQQALPQYEISTFIARGGMGAVYKGTQKTLKRSVAIKVLPPEIDDGDMQFAERFKREAQSMAQLTHPNIVAVFDAGETAQGLLYFVMEFIEGTDVAQLIQSEKRLDPQRAMSITTAVCDALAFAHEEGIIHRDIKPSNIMLDRRGRVKVADFGLAKTVNMESTMLTGSNVAMGTPDFIAPEALIAGIAVDGRADVYAVGVMLYQMLTGSIPRGRFALPSGVIAQIDPRLDAIVDKAMQTDRERRYSTATEMKVDVECVTRSGGLQPPSPAAPAVANRRSLKGTILVTLSALVVAAAAFFFTRQPQQTEITTTSSSPGLLVSKFSPPEPAAIKLWDSAEKIISNPKVEWTDGAVHLTENTGLYERPLSRDAIIRASIRMNTDAKGPQINLRHLGDDQYRLAINPKDNYVVLGTSSSDKVTSLMQWPLARRYREDEWLRLELRAIGNQLTAMADGVELGTITDNALSQPGSAGIFATNGYFRDIEYVPLEAPAAQQTAKANPSVFPPGKWIKWPAGFIESPDATQAIESVSSKEEEWLLPRAKVMVPFRHNRFSNVGLRAKFRQMDGNQGAALVLRSNADSNLQCLTDRARPGVISVFDQKSNRHKILTSSSAKIPAAGTEFTMEFYAVGPRLVSRINGSLETTQQDANPRDGTAFLQSWLPFTDLEIINLDGLSEVEALKLIGVND